MARKKQEITEIQELFNEDIKTDVLVGMLPEGMAETKHAQEIEDKISKYRKYIEDYLIKEFGEVPLAYEFQMEIFFDSLRRYWQVGYVLEETGIYDHENKRKNGLLSTQKDLAASILKMSTMFGLNFWGRSKIKKQETDDSDDFIDALTR